MSNGNAQDALWPSAGESHHFLQYHNENNRKHVGGGLNEANHSHKNQWQYGT
jgi:hypothetical protein